MVDEDDRVVDVVTRAEVRARNLLHRCAEIVVRSGAGEIWVHRRTDTKDVYPGLYDMVVGGVLASGEPWEPQPEEVAWGAFVTLHELDRLLREREFCPDSLEIFARWRGGKLDA